MPDLIFKYNVWWPEGASALEIERECIRQGGRWTVKGKERGAGLFEHFKAFFDLCWPEDHHNRWSDLILSNLVTNRLTVVAGPKNSQKTRTGAKWALTKYWASPSDTQVLLTSTDRRGLQQRILGDIKSLFERARRIHSQLEGNFVEAHDAIFTDALSTGEGTRDWRRGIIGVPILSSTGDFQGLAIKNFAGIKQEHRVLLADECFPAGSLVNTPNGMRPIEFIEAGDIVQSAVGPRRVLATSRRMAFRLVRIRYRDGRELICTLHHPILTEKGWKKACELREGQFILGPYESLRHLRAGNGQQNSLWQETLVSVHVHAGWDCAVRYGGTPGKSHPESAGAHAFRRQSYETIGMQKKGQCCTQGVWIASQGQGWERNRPNESGMATDADVSRSYLELRNQNREVERERVSTCLQSGHRIPGDQVGRRSGRRLPQQLGWAQRQGSEERSLSRGTWVEGVEILEQTDSRFPKSGENSGGCAVYNLQVEGSPTYCVNGLVVHNCQFVPVEYLKVLDSLDDGDFAACMLLNPIAGNGKAGDRVSEPIHGWGSIGEVTKTTTWKNKYGGVTVQLVGTDSPNFDIPLVHYYKNLIDRKMADAVASRPGGKDSREWWSLIMGVRKSGVLDYRVLTVELVESNHGFDDCKWEMEPEIKVIGIDAGFGGDPCILTWAMCGKEVGKGQVMRFGDQEEIPIVISPALTPEKQIALYVKKRCDELGVAPEGVFAECGMRATLMQEMALIVGVGVNAVNAGGPATQRPVHNEFYIDDEKTGQKRLKTCYEHYSKFVTELSFTVRELVIGGQARKFPIGAAEEFGQRESRDVYNNRIELETKREYKERMGAGSPNLSDSAAITVEGARRMGFVLERVSDGTGQGKAPERDWLGDAADEQEKLESERELIYD